MGRGPGQEARATGTREPQPSKRGGGPEPLAPYTMVACCCMLSMGVRYLRGQELHPTATVENMTSGVNRLQGCIFVGHTNTDCDRCALS